jgi:predicted GNAT family acetyltransferase
VAEEFDLIAGLGLRLVRIFLLWEDFQPTPDVISEQALADLEAVCDVAAARDLGLDVTFFTGHMSGPNWAPAWLLGGAEPVAGDRQVVSGTDLDAGPYRNPYSDPMALDAAERQIRAVVGRLAGHPGVWAWNLGNEPDNFAVPPSDELGAAWARRLFAAVAELDPDRHRTVGLHSPSLSTRNHLRADQVFAGADIAVMHAYPIYANFGGDPLDPDVVPFATALTAALAGRPTMMEEFGACTAPPGSGTVDWQWATPRGRFEQVMLGAHGRGPAPAGGGRCDRSHGLVLRRLPRVPVGPAAVRRASPRATLRVGPTRRLAQAPRGGAPSVRGVQATHPPAFAASEHGGRRGRLLRRSGGGPARPLLGVSAGTCERGGAMTEDREPMAEPQPMPSERELHVRDVPGKSRYEARLGDDATLAALIDYRQGDRWMALVHTEVREGFEGQGLGSRLVRAVLEDLRERGIAVVPKCPFVLSWLQRHPEQHDVLFRPLETPGPDEPGTA